MKSNSIFILSLLISFFCNTTNALEIQDKTKAILLFRININKQEIGEPGQIVFLSKVDSTGDKATIEVNGKFYENVSLSRVLPYDSEFTVSRIYLYLSKTTWAVYSANQSIETKNLFLLAKNTCNTFKTNALYEEILALACEYSEQFENISSDGKTEFLQTIDIANKYRLEFPKGKYIDKIEWQLTRIKNHSYEFEGNASLVLEQIKAYEEYLQQSPHTIFLDEVNLEIGRLYRIASECILYNYKNNNENGFNQIEGNNLLRRAKELFFELGHSQNIKVRETAKVHLYNILHQRNCYIKASDL